jgi:hypothetical protein
MRRTEGEDMSTTINPALPAVALRPTASAPPPDPAPPRSQPTGAPSEAKPPEGQASHPDQTNPSVARKLASAAVDRVPEAAPVIPEVVILIALAAAGKALDDPTERRIASDAESAWSERRTPDPGAV